MDKRKKNKRPLVPRFFYLDSCLHKLIRAHRGADIVVAWRFKDERRVSYPLSQIRKHATQAYSMRQVAKLINRHPERVRHYMNDGHIRKPEKGGIQKTPQSRYYFSEDDVYELHTYLMSTHWGRPRKDGLTFPAPNLPSRAELRAKMRQEMITYIKTEDGEFIPTFREQDW